MPSLRSLDPSFRPWAQALYDVARRYKLRPTITSTRRTSAEQAALYRKYISGQSRLPAAPPGQSLHEYGLAVDIFVPSEEWQRWLGEVWRYWGGRWYESDPVHFEVA